MGDRKEPRPVPTNQVRPAPPPPPPRKRLDGGYSPTAAEPGPPPTSNTAIVRAWHVERNINDYGIVRGNQQIAGYIVSKHDARLMAAAPDLLAALKDVLAVASANAEDVESGQTCAACDRARQAIRKAEG